MYRTFILHHVMDCFLSVLVGELVFPFVLMQFVCHLQCDKNKLNLYALRFHHTVCLYIPSCIEATYHCQLCTILCMVLLLFTHAFNISSITSSIYLEDKRKRSIDQVMVAGVLT